MAEGIVQVSDSGGHITPVTIPITLTGGGGLLGWNQQDNRMGARRVYATWANRTSMASSAVSIANAGYYVLFSIKPPATTNTGLQNVANGQYDADFTALFNALPANCHIAFYHEPENDSVTGTNFKNAFNRVAGLMRPNQTPTVCLMSWTFDPASGRNPNDWLPSGAEMLALDPYNMAFSNSNPGAPWRMPDWLISWALPYVQGRELAIWETNSYEDPNNAMRKADWLRAWGPVCEANAIKHLTFFDSVSGQPNTFRLFSSANATTAFNELVARPYFA